MEGRLNDRGLIKQYWEDIGCQNWGALARYFQEDAAICWHNTNEQFTVEEFVRVNTQYPGDWRIGVERLICAGDTVISVVKVSDRAVSFHAVSFFSFRENRIAALDEYWGEDQQTPGWRRELRIGRPIG